MASAIHHALSFPGDCSSSSSSSDTAENAKVLRKFEQTINWLSCVTALPLLVSFFCLRAGSWLLAAVFASVAVAHVHFRYIRTRDMMDLDVQTVVFSVAALLCKDVTKKANCSK